MSHAKCYEKRLVLEERIRSLESALLEARGALEKTLEGFDLGIDRLDMSNAIHEALVRLSSLDLGRAEKERAVVEAGKPIYHNWHEEGGGLIVPTGNGFVLYEVPQYGGVPRFAKHCATLEEAEKIADGWT